MDQENPEIRRIRVQTAMRWAQKNMPTRPAIVFSEIPVLSGRCLLQSAEGVPVKCLCPDDRELLCIFRPYDATGDVSPADAPFQIQIFPGFCPLPAV